MLRDVYYPLSMEINNHLHCVSILDSCIQEYIRKEDYDIVGKRDIPVGIAAIKYKVEQNSREVKEDIGAFVRTRGFLASPVYELSKDYDFCVSTFMDCARLMRPDDGRMIELLSPSKKYITKPLPPFPFKSIKTARQCADCFQLLTREIAWLSHAIDDGIDTLDSPMIFGESIDPKDYRDISMYLQKCARRVAEISALIRNYLANGTTYIRGKENIPVNIPNAVEIVNGDTDHVESHFKVYNKRRSANTPPIDTWFDTFADGVAQFN